MQVAAGMLHTVGLKSDGTVVAVGDNDGGAAGRGLLEQYRAGGRRCLSYRGLKSDGTVVAVGDNVYGQLNVATWKLGRAKKTRTDFDLNGDERTDIAAFHHPSDQFFTATPAIWASTAGAEPTAILWSGTMTGTG